MSSLLQCIAQPTCIAWAPDRADVIIAGLEDGSVALWDLGEAESLHSVYQLPNVPHTETKGRDLLLLYNFWSGQKKSYRADVLRSALCRAVQAKTNRSRECIRMPSFSSCHLLEDNHVAPLQRIVPLHAQVRT